MTFNEYLARRTIEAAIFPLTDPEQIKDIPWHGNHASDHMWFEKIQDYIRACPDRDKQKRALFLLGLYGMGIDSPAVSDEDLDFYLSFDSKQEG